MSARIASLVSHMMTFLLGGQIFQKVTYSFEPKNLVAVMAGNDIR